VGSVKWEVLSGKWGRKRGMSEEAYLEYAISSFVFVLSVPEVLSVPFAGSPVDSEVLRGK
jgi:hypothetical protein